MRVLFAGAPDFAVPSLEALPDVCEVVAVLTNRDRQAGRGGRAQGSSVRIAAERLGVPVLTPERLDAEAVAQVTALQPQLLVVAAFGTIFRRRFLDAFPQGGVNLHPSLLPQHRGPTPIPAAILAGDEITGVTIQGIEMKVDSGPIYAQQRVPLNGRESTADLTPKLAAVGARALADVVAGIADGTARTVPQDDSAASYCGLLAKEDGRIDWSLPAAIIERRIRAFNPWPRAHTCLGDLGLGVLMAETVAGQAAGPPGLVAGVDKRRGILIHTGRDMLALQYLHPAGRRPMDFTAFVNGRPDLTGRRLSCA